jgi:glycine cleavage system H protein
VAELTYPDNLQYTKDHEWAKKSGGTITIGITAFAQNQLGDVVYVELPAVGTQITAGQPFGVVESTKAVSELFAPVSGKVVERNDALVSSPESLNDDPYDRGWMIRVEPSNASLDGLMDRAAYEKHVQEQDH